jgi:hypothetical protein
MEAMTRIATALALLAAAVALAGCGAQSVIDPVAAAATKSQNAGGVHVSMRIAVDSPLLGETVVTGEGAFDQDQGDLTLDLSGLAQQLPIPLGEVKAIYATENGDPVVYVGLPLLANVLPGGKQWIRADLAHAASAAGIDLSQVLGQAGANPAEILGLLRASGEVTEVGQDVIDGTDVTHYRANIDLQKALTTKGVPAEVVQRLLDAGAPSTLPVDVWIGDDGLPRQVTAAYELPAGGATAKAALTLKLTDWGTPVSVQTPPADQVFEAN